MLSRAHALAAAAEDFITTGTGKRPALARMAAGDRVLVYSPRTEHPGGEPLSAVTAVGEVTGAQPIEVAGEQYRRAARLTVITPVPLADVREHLPVSLLRFGCFALNAERADPLWALVGGGVKRRRRRSILWTHVKMPAWVGSLTHFVLPASFLFGIGRRGCVWLL